MVAAALYSPVLSRVIDNRFVESSGSFASKTILSLLPTITDQFISLRYLFIPLALLGLISSIKNYIRQADKSLGYIAQGLLLLVIPFLLSAFRGDKPFDRIFIPLSVVFALTLGALIYSSLAVIASRKSFQNVLMVVFLIYCQVAFVSAIQNRNNRLIEDIYGGSKSQNIFYNYFQEYYAPLAVFGTLANEVRNDGNPRVCHYADGDTVVTRYYFSKYHLESKRADTWAIMEDCLQEKSYVMTAFPNKFISFVEENNSKYTCSQISDLYFQTLFKCD
jgi:hypothetical protein